MLKRVLAGLALYVAVGCASQESAIRHVPTGPYFTRQDYGAYVDPETRKQYAFSYNTGDSSPENISELVIAARNRKTVPHSMRVTDFGSDKKFDMVRVQRILGGPVEECPFERAPEDIRTFILAVDEYRLSGSERIVTGK